MHLLDRDFYIQIVDSPSKSACVLYHFLYFIPFPHANPSFSLSKQGFKTSFSLSNLLYSIISFYSWLVKL